MHRGYQDSQLRFLYVLQLVDEYRKRSIRSFSCEPYLLEEGLQVVLEVAIVGKTGFRFVIKTHLDVGVCNLEHLGEARECAQSAYGKVLCLVYLTESQQRLPKLWREQRGKRSSFRRLDTHGMNAY